MNSPRIIRVGGEIMDSYGTLSVEDRVKGARDIFRGLLQQIMMEPSIDPVEIEDIINGLNDGITTLEEWKRRNSVPRIEDKRQELDPDLY